MAKITNLIVMSIFLVLFVFGLVPAQQEQLTITTYYPSPYGSYRELTAYRMKIGTTYSGAGTAVADNNLIVEGSVGIGTSTPQELPPNGLTGNLDVNDIWLRSTQTWLSQGVGGGVFSLVKYGFISTNTSNLNLGQDWTLVNFAGQYVSGDSGPAGGFIFFNRTTNKKIATLYSATDGHCEGTLSATRLCTYPTETEDFKGQFCAWVDGAGDVHVSTGTQVQLEYMAFR